MLDIGCISAAALKYLQNSLLDCNSQCPKDNARCQEKQVLLKPGELDRILWTIRELTILRKLYMQVDLDVGICLKVNTQTKDTKTEYEFTSLAHNTKWATKKNVL